MTSSADTKFCSQAMRELQNILRKPYKDVCNTCSGSGLMNSDTPCPKCRGTGYRLLKLL